MEICEETKSMMRINGDYGKDFWTTKGVRQRVSVKSATL